MARKRLPRSLQELHVFLDANIFSVHPRQAELYEKNEEGKRATDFARASRTFQSITISYIINSLAFFFAARGIRRLPRQRASLWPRLNTIALTDMQLAPTKHGETVLQIAGHMALEMPKLKILELWYSTSTDACFFRFEASTPPKITMKGTWDMQRIWTRTCHEVWTMTAATFSIHPLQVTIGLLPKDTCTVKSFYGGILKYLELRDKIVDPVTRYQMEREMGVKGEQTGPGESWDNA